MDVDSDRSDDDTSSAHAAVLALAAHPLNSCNPPPEDLPDLLDSVIRSEKQLCEALVLCTQSADGLDRRTMDVKNRLDTLRVAHPQYRTDGSIVKEARGSSKQRLCFEACEKLYRRMYLQTSFMCFCVEFKLKRMLQMNIKAHRDILDTFLGERHDHAGIEVASSDELQCTPGCEWYDKYGHFEWSKIPYTNQWWQEMNNTSWDWFRVRQHVTNTVATARGRAILPVDLFHQNARTFVPFWFWAGDRESWSPWIDVLPVETAEGTTVEGVVCKIRFKKTEAMVRKERPDEHGRLRQRRTVQEGRGSNHLEHHDDIDMDQFGEERMDPSVVFDAHIQAPDWDNETRPIRVGSWLDWWGYQKWFANNAGNTADSVRVQV